MAETNDGNIQTDSVEVAIGGDLGQGDSNCPNTQGEESIKEKLNEDQASEVVHVLTEDAYVNQDTSQEGYTSIKNLPNEMLAHIFSYLDIKERIRNELVCRHWRWIGKHTPWTYPTKLVFSRHAKKSTFSLPVTDLNDNILFSLLSRCGSCLKQIHLTSRHSDDVSLTCKSIMTISLFCPNLEVIKLHLRLTSDCLETLARGCPNLRVVKIFNLDTNRHDAGVIAITRKCPCLEVLEVSFVYLADEWFDVVNPKLRKLCLSECTIMPIAMTNLMKKCNSLQELHLAFCNKIDMDESVLFKVCAHFKETLKVLKVQCIDVTDDFNWCQGLKGLHALQELTLEMCSSVDDKLLEVLVKECPRLRLLAVPGSHVTDDGLKSLLALPYLGILDLSCTKVLGEGLEILAERGILEEVYLKASDVKEASCCSLARLCPNLRLLDVTGSTEITNGLLKEFAEASKLGYFKNAVKLLVGCTSAMKNNETWDRLNVDFISH